MFHGDGIFIHKNGQRYEGQFKKNKKNGQGMYYYLNGNIFKG